MVIKLWVGTLIVAKINIGGGNRVGGDQAVGGNLEKVVEPRSNVLTAVAFIILTLGLAGAAGVAIKIRAVGIDAETQTKQVEVNSE